MFLLADGHADVHRAQQRKDERLNEGHQELHQSHEDIKEKGNRGDSPTDSGGHLTENENQRHESQRDDVASGDIGEKSHHQHERFGEDTDGFHQRHDRQRDLQPPRHTRGVEDVLPVLLARGERGHEEGDECQNAGHSDVAGEVRAARENWDDAQHVVQEDKEEQREQVRCVFVGVATQRRGDDLILQEDDDGFHQRLQTAGHFVGMFFITFCYRKEYASNQNQGDEECAHILGDGNIPFADVSLIFLALLKMSGVVGVVAVECHDAAFVIAPAHGIAVGDVDGDGYDEIMFGSAALDHDGSLLYTTKLGHGDAVHLTDIDPDRPGLEYFMPHEVKPFGVSLRDARTGEMLFREHGERDTGRGLAADIDSLHRGMEFWSSSHKVVHDCKGNEITTTKNSIPINFRIYWDGDLYDELIGNSVNKGAAGETPIPYYQYYVAKWTGHNVERIKINGKDFSEWGYSTSCNGTKATPCLQADLFGDWREEIILYDGSDNAHLNVFSTNLPTQYRVVTPMHDHIYRMCVAWQNVGYNQPPHLGYYLPDSIKKKEKK